MLGLAGVAAGMTNALAGGGTLITFPLLTALGVPPVAANITNTIALCPGYLAATFAQHKALAGQTGRLRLMWPGAVAGGIAGSALLLATRESSFRVLVPYLILLASVLLAIQNPVHAWIRRQKHTAFKSHEKWAALFVGIAAIYGGYFGAGMSVMILAALGLLIDDSLTELNALKQSLSFLTNISAAVFLLFSGRVFPYHAVVLAAGASIGGMLGGKMAGRIHPEALRWTVVVLGVAIAIVFFLHKV